MSPFGWFRKKPEADGLAAWRRAWETASAAPNHAAVSRLGTALAEAAGEAEDLEVEQEMLAGLTAAADLAASLTEGLPIVDTGHRAVGTDICHFSAPATRADTEAQPSGRLLLTSRRAIFLGGGAAVTVPWHAVAEAAAIARDLVLARRDRGGAHVFRCNSYADALCARLLAARLAAAHRPAPRV